MSCCHPYGVQAMWSERSRLRRLGTALGSLGKVAVLAVRFLRRVSRRATGWASATSQETHGEDGNLPKGPRGGPKPPETASLRPRGSHTIRVAAWHLELHFGGPRGAVETPRPGPEKLEGQLDKTQT